MFFKKKNTPPKTNTVPTSILPLVQEYTMGSPESLLLHELLGKYVKDLKIEGDIVECGVYNGGSAAAMAAGADMQHRTLWLYDSFEGMPPTDSIDGVDAAKYIGQCVGDIEKVKEVLTKINLAESAYNIKKGWFENTFKDPGPESIALLHIDSDWYNSVMSCLDRFYDLVVDGGVILLDDFGHWEGCRNAFFDFVSKRQIKPLVERRGHTQLFWIKGKEHNRDRSGLKMPHENLQL